MSEILKGFEGLCFFSIYILVSETKICYQYEAKKGKQNAEAGSSQLEFIYSGGGGKENDHGCH